MIMLRYKRRYRRQVLLEGSRFPWVRCALLLLVSAAVWMCGDGDGAK